MKDKLLNEIMSNFKQQIALYEEMLNLSHLQLNLLEDDAGFDRNNDLPDLLGKRYRLLHDISFLNVENKDLQKQFSEVCGIDDLMLSKLQGKIDSEKYYGLKALLADLGEVLERINDIDKQSELLILQCCGQTQDRNNVANNRQAVDAYKNQLKNKPQQIK